MCACVLDIESVSKLAIAIQLGQIHRPNLDCICALMPPFDINNDYDNPNVDSRSLNKTGLASEHLPKGYVSDGNLLR